MRKLFFIIFTLAALFTAGSVSALTVSPVRIEIAGDPGTTLSGAIELFNEQNNQGEKVFYTSFENFEPSGDTGAPRFIGAKDGLATWIKSEGKVVLDSGVRVTVPYSIDIPKEAEPGGYFAAIFFGTQDPGSQGEGQVSVGGKIGVLMMLRVTGDIEENAGLLDFSAKEKKRFFTSLPVTFTYRINNAGGDRIMPSGEIKIKNTFQFKTAELPANKNSGNILPGSSRKYEVTWGEETAGTSAEENAEISKIKKYWQDFLGKTKNQLKAFHFGWYRAELDLSWSAEKQTANASYSFFIIPWQILLLAGIVLLILLNLGGRIIRRYNRWIIAKASAQR